MVYHYFGWGTDSVPFFIGSSEFDVTIKVIINFMLKKVTIIILSLIALIAVAALVYQQLAPEGEKQQTTQEQSKVALLNQKPKSEISWRDIENNILSCIELAFPKSPPDYYVITSKNQLEQLFERAVQNPSFKYSSCKEADFRKIFSEVEPTAEDLLGARWIGSGCDRELLKSVIRKAGDRQIVFNLQVKEYGTCEPMFRGLEWIAIPNIPDGYSVKFIVSNPQQNYYREKIISPPYSIESANR